MSDRYNGAIVTLENDLTEDEAQSTLSAILQIKGVISVEMNVSDVGSHLAEQRAKMNLRKKILDLLF